MYKNPYDENDANGKYTELQQILDNVPNIEDGSGKTALYVGASCSRAFLHDVLWEFGYTVDIIEIDEENIKCIKEKYKFKNLICGNIADKDKLTENYDLIFWYHGPEHVSKNDFFHIDKILESKSKIIVLGCPHDDHNVYDDNPNVFEKHIWRIKQEDLQEFGYNTSVVSRINAVDNIVAWKKI